MGVFGTRKSVLKYTVRSRSIGHTKKIMIIKLERHLYEVHIDEPKYLFKCIEQNCSMNIHSKKLTGNDEFLRENF